MVKNHISSIVNATHALIATASPALSRLVLLAPKDIMRGMDTLALPAQISARHAMQLAAVSAPITSY